jgi:long-chain acyl-CoA synthetase
MKELVYPRLFYPAVERDPERVGFIDGQYRATYAQHGDRVERLAGALAGLGVGRRHRFAVMAANSHQYLELYHAAYLGAGVVNPLNLRLAGPELRFILEDSGTSVVFVDDFFADHLRRSLEGSDLDLQVVRIGSPGEGELDYEALLSSSAPRVPEEPEEDDPVVLMYTGGTTGLPKGVLLDQRAELLNLYHIAFTFGLGDERVYLHQTPMFHAASMGGALGVPASGGVSVFVPLFEPGAVMAAIEDAAVNWTVMVPTMIGMVLDHPEFAPERLATLRDLVYGASPMPAALVERLIGIFPELNIWQGYGMTESSSVLTVLTDEDHRRGGARLRSAGRPAMGVVLSIQDDQGTPLGPGQEGEVCARAGNVMTEYWHRPEETADAFRDGWYHTGDAGYLDEGGYLFLVDRVKDMIVTGGENVYSVEVENAISSHPAVSQVAVIGIPDPKWGEAVHAVVVLNPGRTATAEEIQEHARTNIAGYKVPKSVEFRTEPLPLSGAMKVLKRDLRAPYWDKGAAGA